MLPEKAKQNGIAFHTDDHITNWVKVDEIEMKAFLGVMILIGILKGKFGTIN